MITDLHEADTLLSTKYVNGKLKEYQTDVEKVRPNSWVAKSLLARVQLYNHDWESAEQAASAVINSGFYDTVSLNEVFLRNSKEAIWQLQPTAQGTGITNTYDALYFTIPPSGPNSNRPVYLSARLLSSFENGDMRLADWVDSVDVLGTVYHYPSKYKVIETDAPVSEYLTLLRISELYLIRAEARAELNNLSGALQDLNIIHRRAGLTDISLTTPEEIKNAILNERQVELFCELGHRWLDMKRSGTIDSIMPDVVLSKTGTDSWQSYKQWFPLPATDIRLAPQIIQNTGY